jgi:hypothetical protein
MKQPKSPTRPYAPWKPQSPAKTVDENTRIAEVIVDKYSLYSIESFADFIKDQAANIDPKDIRMEFEIESEHMYDDYTHTIKLTLFSQRQIDNPKYEAQYKQYLTMLEKYEKENLKYKEALKKYNKDSKAYPLEFDKWMLQRSKAQVKQLEAKLAKTTK